MLKNRRVPSTVSGGRDSKQGVKPEEVESGAQTGPDELDLLVVTLDLRS